MLDAGAMSRIERNYGREVASTRIPGNELQRTPVVKGTFLRPLYLVPHRLTPAERHAASASSPTSERSCGLRTGNETEDWLDAEREVDAGRY